jgi:hypothetical protein
MEKNSSFQWFGIKKAWEQLMGVPILFWPIALPVIVVKVALYVCLLAITLFMAVMYPAAVDIVLRHIHRTERSMNSRSNSARLKGEEWQRGNQQRGSLIRSGGSLNSDDLRHRLNELRSSKSGGPERRAPKTGGHYAKQ